MTARIHLLIDERERDAYRSRAISEGLSLSEWLRNAARAQLERERPERLVTAEDLDRFFLECAASEGGTEPDWDQHLEVVAASRRAGLEPG